MNENNNNFSLDIEKIDYYIKTVDDYYNQLLSYTRQVKIYLDGIHGIAPTPNINKLILLNEKMNTQTSNFFLLEQQAPFQLFISEIRSYCRLTDRLKMLKPSKYNINDGSNEIAMEEYLKEKTKIENELKQIKQKIENANNYERIQK
jgi:hypothetical protein